MTYHYLSFSFLEMLVLSLLFCVSLQFPLSRIVIDVFLYFVPFPSIYDSIDEEVLSKSRNAYLSSFFSILSSSCHLLPWYTEFLYYIFPYMTIRVVMDSPVVSDAWKSKSWPFALLYILMFMSSLEHETCFIFLNPSASSAHKMLNRDSIPSNLHDLCTQCLCGCGSECQFFYYIQQTAAYSLNVDSC